MLLFGILRNSFFLSTLLFCRLAFSDQYLSGQSGLPEMKVDGDLDSPHLLDGVDKSFISKDKAPSFSLPGGTINENYISKETERNSLLTTDQENMGTFDNSSSYIDYDKKKMFYKIQNKGKSAFSFSYIMDTYTVDDDRGVYAQVFENSSKAVEGGSLHFNMDYFFYRGRANLAWGSNIGVGFSMGNGFFADGSESDAIFKLWTVPIDFSLTVEIPVTTFAKLVATGGPSVMGLFQNRSDYEKNESGKRRRQVSYGYFAGGKLKMSISRWLINEMVSMFNVSKITNSFFNLEARHHYYGNFQDNIIISGTSFGVGFTFEFF